MLLQALAIVASYVAGSFPSAWLAGKSSGVDLRSHGSGNLGATNVLRVLGPKIGATVFLADAAKGFLPVFFFPAMTATTGTALVTLQIVCGIAAVLGHARPVFLGFSKGGKGVATACGVFLALAPLQTAVTLVTFSVVVLLSGFVSLASMSAAFALPVALSASFGISSPLFPVGVLTFVFVTWTHRANIERLRAGSEHRFERTAKLGIVPTIIIALFVLGAATGWLVVRPR